MGASLLALAKSVYYTVVFRGGDKALLRMLYGLTRG